MPRAAATATALTFLALAGAAIAASGGTSTQAQAAAANPLRGDAMYIWYVGKAQRGNPDKIAAVAKRRGIEVVLIKNGDADNRWRQFTAKLVRKLKARGLRVCAWQFVYGSRPWREANVGAGAKGRGADCLVIDAEGHYEGRYAQASTYMRRLRSLVGPDYPLALSSFPYVDYHPAFPYSVFLGPGGAQYNMPQLYWKTIGDRVDHAFVRTFVFNRGYGRPILPTGQVYLNPKPGQIVRFRKLARAHGMQGVSWWSWQHARKRQWRAVGRRIKPLRGYRPYRSYAFLRQGMRGDLIVWSQQLLRGAGRNLKINGYFTGGMRNHVLGFQGSQGLEQTGNVDKPTWDRLLTFEPFAVRWTKQGAKPARSSSPHVMAEPASAKLPAKGYEIPRRGSRAPK